MRVRQRLASRLRRLADRLDRTGSLTIEIQRMGNQVRWRGVEEGPGPELPEDWTEVGATEHGWRWDLDAPDESR